MGEKVRPFFVLLDQFQVEAVIKTLERPARRITLFEFNLFGRGMRPESSSKRSCKKFAIRSARALSRASRSCGRNSGYFASLLLYQSSFVYHDFKLLSSQIDIQEQIVKTGPDFTQMIK